MLLHKWMRRYYENEGGGGGDGGDGQQQQQQNNGGGGGDGQQQQQQQQQPPHWSTALPEDLRGHEFVKGSKDLADFAKQSVNAQGLLGRKGAIVPTDWNNKDEVARFHEAIGVPKAYTEYKVPDRSDKQPYSDVDKAFQGAMLPVLHEAGLTQRQVETITGAFNEHQIKLEGTFKAFADKTSAALDTKWGADKPAKLAAGKSFATKVLGDQYENLKRVPIVGGGFAADHPLVLELLAAAGEAMGEDGGAGGSGGGGGGSDPLASPEAAKAYVDAQYAAAEADQKHWLNHPTDEAGKTNREYLQRVQRLAAQLKPAK